MNQELKKTFGEFPFVYNGEFNAVFFNVIQHKDGMMNLIMDYAFINDDDDNYPIEYGMSMVTSVYKPNLVDLRNYIEQVLNLGMFTDMIFLSEGICMNSDGDIMYEFDWSDYLLKDNSIIN